MMKRTIPDIYKKQAVPLAIFVVLSLLVWFAGSWGLFGNTHPSDATQKKGYIITALFLMWILKFIFFDATPSKKKQPVTPSLSPDTEKKLQTLQGRFQGALDFLKNTLIQKHGKKVNLSHLPWYLLTGPVLAGKTALLVHSKVNFILSKQVGEKETSDKSSDACDWWATRDLVLVDVPGQYFTGREKSNSSLILWHTLLNLLKKTRAKDNLRGIIIALNLPEILQKTKQNGQQALIHDLKKRIIELRDQFGTQCAFHFVITKCDLLPGFTEFFSEALIDELAQPFGFGLPPLRSSDKLSDIFTLRFNALIKQVNRQLLFRLHQERSSRARHAIKDFPLHLERLKMMIVTTLNALAIPDLHLESIHLTSATQTPIESSSYTHTPAGHLTHQALDIMQPPALPARACFIKQLITHGLLHAAETRTVEPRTDYHWQRRAMIAASIGVIVTATLIMGQDFRHGIQKAYALQNELYRYQLAVQQNSQGKNARDNLIQALPLLDSLEQAANVSEHRLTRIENMLFFYSNRSEETARIIYTKALQTIVLPEIETTLDNYLQEAGTKDPTLVYTVLEASLMLGDPKRFNAAFIADTLQKTGNIPMNFHARNQLTAHIRAAFKTRSGNFIPDEAVVANVRKQLINLPVAELGFVILKNRDDNNADSTLALGTNLGRPPVFVSKQVTNRIPNMFTATHFQKILNEEIHSAAMEAQNGNWIVGTITPSDNQPSVDTLAAELQKQYIAKYVDIWESQLANIEPYTPKNLLQADEVIENLTNNDSPLLQLLQTIRENTTFDPIMNASPKISALNNLISNPDIRQSALHTVFVNLKQLHLYLQTILNAPNPDKSAFQAAANRMKNPAEDPITTIHALAEENPEPLKSWLNTLANQSWNFILQKAGDTAENAWATTVLPVYQQQIADRYPINQKSPRDVNLTCLTHFLGHRGILANYYLIYIKPFVNDSGETWTWKTIDNQHIPFSNDALARFQHAAELQRAFFPNQDNKLALEFTLQPISPDPVMKTLTLTINGQQAIFQRNGKRLPHTFIWPGNYDFHDTTVSFITPNNQLASQTLKGDWGLFRLISQSTEGVNAKKALMLNIAANGHSAKYLLFTRNGLNPFLSANTDALQLPDSLS